MFHRFSHKPLSDFTVSSFLSIAYRCCDSISTVFYIQDSFSIKISSIHKKKEKKKIPFPLCVVAHACNISTGKGSGRRTPLNSRPACATYQDPASKSLKIIMNKKIFPVLILPSVVFLCFGFLLLFLFCLLKTGFLWVALSVLELTR